MITGIFHKGSGLGNQLHRYVATRVLAMDKGYEFGIVAPDLFKGKDFMSLDIGLVNEIEYGIYEGGKVIANSSYPLWEEWNKHCYDPDYNFIEDNTVIDGEFQDERYFEHRLPQIREWLQVEPLDMPDDVCVINFRGGEYQYVPELFLPQEYWDKAVALMKEKYPFIRFEVDTDDMETARKFFPDYPIFHNIGLNWRSIRYAKHLILSNSSFAILPALLNEDVREVICPRYWNRYNTKQWDFPQNYYKKFMYI